MSQRFHIQPVQVAGCPGPPSCFLREDEDEDDMIMVNGPDDLGDLMQQMREGAAWAEGLAMEGHLSLCPAPAGTADAAEAASGSSADLEGYALPASALPSQAPAEPANVQPADAAPASGPAPDTGSAPSTRSPGVGAATLAAVNRRQQREAEQDAAMSELQPAMRALLMHPGVAGSGQLMIPVSGAAHTAAVGDPAGSCGPPPQALGGAPAETAERPGSHLPSWQAPQLERPQFYSQQGQYGAPRGPAMAAFQPTPFAFYQAPVSFMPGPPPDCPPPLPHSAAAALAWHQHQHQRSGGTYMPLMLPPGCMAPMPQGQSNPSAASGSANASDGTTLRVRSSFDADASGSGSAGCAAASGARAPAGAARAGSGAPPPAVVPQLSLPECDSGFAHGQPAGACASGWEWRPAGSKCDAPTDSSDCDDGGGACERYETTAQVVPEVEPEVAAAFALPPPPPVLPMPLPLPTAPPLMATMPMSAAPPHALAATLGGWSVADFPPMPTFCGFYDSPAAHAARLARHASLERYRLKKARRCAGKKIRYVKRKVNADKRPRIKGRFIKAGDAADLLASAAAGDPGSPISCSDAPTGSSGDASIAAA